MPSSHEARSVPWRSCCVGTLEYHTNPCVQIVTDAALINSTMLQRPRCGGFNPAGYSAGLPARDRALCPLRHSSNRCTPAKNGGPNSTARQGEANIPAEPLIPVDTRG